MKKGQMAFLQSFVVGLVVAGVLLTIGAYVTSEVQGQMTSGTRAYLAGGNATLALGDIAGWLPIVGIAGIAGVILTLILVYVAGRR